MNDILAAIGIHGPLAAVVLGAVMWGRTHHKEDHERFSKIEQDQKADIQRVYDAIQHTADQNTEILKLLAQRRQD